MGSGSVLTHPATIIGYAVFLWWFSTGLVLYLNRRPRWTFKWSLAGGTALFAAALAGLGWSAQATTPAALFCAFSCGLIAWGWQELTFYLGYVTGPRRIRCEPGCCGWRHFRHALQVSAHHELSIAATALVLIAVTWGAPNKLALWTFLLVMGMHQSARINVFLGVRNVNEEWVPDHMAFLKSFLRQRPINPFFLPSQAAALAVEIWLIDAALAAAPGSAPAIGYAFLATMMGLAIIEHWFLILPLPLTALWNWFNRSAAVDAAKNEAHDLRQAEYAEPNPSAHHAPVRRVGGKDTTILPRMAPETPGRTS